MEQTQRSMSLKGSLLLNAADWIDFCEYFLSIVILKALYRFFAYLPQKMCAILILLRIIQNMLHLSANLCSG